MTTMVSLIIQVECLCNRERISDVLGGELEYEFFHRWFNTLFLASSLLTMLLFYFQYKNSRQEPELPMYTHRA